MDALIFNPFVYPSSLHSKITFSGHAVKRGKKFLLSTSLNIVAAVFCVQHCSAQYFQRLKQAPSLGVCRVTHTLHLPNDCGPERKRIVFAGTLNQSAAARLRLAGASRACRHRATKGLRFFFPCCSNSTKKWCKHAHVRPPLHPLARPCACPNPPTPPPHPPLSNGSRIWRCRHGLLLLSKTGQAPVSLERFR